MSGFPLSEIEFCNWLECNAVLSKDKSEASLSLFLFPKVLLWSERNKPNARTIDTPSAVPQLTSAESDEAGLAAKGLTCLTCKLLFSNSAEQRQHFKSEYHLFNLKRQLKNIVANPISLKEYTTTTSRRKDFGHETESSTQTVVVHTEENNVEGNRNEADESEEKENYDEAYESNSDDYLSDDENNQEFVSSSPLDRYLFVDGVIIVKEDKKRHIPILSVFLADLKPWSFSVNVPSLRWARSYLESSYSRDLSVPAITPWVKVQRFLGELCDNPITIIFVLKSGRFVAIVMDETRVIMHKTHRRYTVRAKAGGSQSSYDSKSGRAKSAGAMLRRHGEQSLKEDIATLLEDWQPYLQSCSMILISAAKSIRHVLFEDKKLMDSSDPRIVSLPFAIRDATMEGAIAAHTRFFTVIFSRNDDSDSNKNGGEVECNRKSDDSTESRTKTRGDKTSGTSSLAHDNVELSVPTSLSTKIGASMPLLYPESSTLNQLCSSGTEDQIKAFIDDLADCGEFTTEEVKIIVNTPDSLQTLNFPLHLAAERGLASVIDMLLTGGANLQSIDIRGRTAYSVAKDKSTRDMFRRHRGSMEKYDPNFDWSATGIPSALTTDIEETRRLKEKEKKKRQQLRKKEQKATNQQILDDAKMATDLQNTEAAAWRQSLKAAEVASAGVCAAPKCEVSLHQQETFDVLGRRCCSAACVMNLRRHLAADAALRRTQQGSACEG